MAHRPTLINLPPPPSDPATPSEGGPGTPNSTTTSLSTLSVIAIKDGAVGHGTRGSQQSANTLEAERADRISRLAGLERVATVRTTPSGHLVPGPGYTNSPYDGVPQLKERSTVGSASATGSLGGRTGWASESMDMDTETDHMSETGDDGVSSIGGFSDEDKGSLVGFGEGAGSTVSGPVSTSNARLLAARNSLNNPTTPRTGALQSGGSTPLSGTMPFGSATGGTDPRMMDGVSYDRDVVDTTTSTPPLVEQTQASSNRFSGAGTEMAENVLRNRFSDDGRGTMGTPPNGQSLGDFGFERE